MLRNERYQGVIALAGNPNSGKTALFNALTGSSQKVGNWPGVTVEKLTGSYMDRHQSFQVVDLPGTYSLNVTSEEGSTDQRIACDYLLSREANVIVNVIDGSNLERNLYLTLQLLEMQKPMVLAVNMMDIVEKRGIFLDLKKLGKQLDCPVVAMVANRSRGLDALRQTILQQIQQPHISHFKLPLLSNITQAIQQIHEMIKQEDPHSVMSLWLAQRLLENDEFAQEQVSENIKTLGNQAIFHIQQATGEDPDILIADARYQWISDLYLSITQLKKNNKVNLTEKIDRFILNRYLGIPIFLIILYLMFVFAIDVGGAFQDFFDLSSNAIFVDGFAQLLYAMQTPPWLIALLANGIGKGINTILTFLPILAGLFFFLTFLEDSGYMARAAFVMDRFMKCLGLPGKSFVPMMIGFGCNVPAVMGTRGLEGKRDRILTILMMPFMSCGARLAIFAVFVSAFFPHRGQDIIFILYVAGIVAAILTGLLLRKTILSGNPAPLVMELPPYHMPQFFLLCRHTGLRLKKFIQRAGSVIVPVCILIGGFNALTVDGKFVQNGDDQYSVLSQVGRVVTPVLAPIGVEQNNWPATVGLMTGILAKEVVIGTLNTLYSQAAGVATNASTAFHMGEELKAAILTIPANLSQLGFAFENPLVAHEASHEVNKTVYGVMVQNFDGKIGAFSYLLFVLLYFPCVSTMAAVRRELSKTWAIFSVVWNTTLAYAISVIVYQSFTFLRHPLSASLWIAGMFTYLSSIILMLRFFKKRKRQDDSMREIIKCL